MDVYLISISCWPRIRGNRKQDFMGGSFCYMKWQNCIITPVFVFSTICWRQKQKMKIHFYKGTYTNLTVVLHSLRWICLSNTTVKQGSKFIFFSQTETWGTERLKPRFRQSECQLNLKVLCFQLARCLWRSVQGHIGCL